jgi:hypothetical protein
MDICPDESVAESGLIENAYQLQSSLVSMNRNCYEVVNGVGPF